MSDPAASPPLDDAVATQLAALLHDRDVSEVTAVEGSPLELVRRGRRERLDVRLDPAVFGMVREEGAAQGLVAYALKGGHRLVAAQLRDGRVAVRVQKAPNVDASLAVLVEEGALSQDAAQELLRGVHTGLGLVVLGPARSGRVRLLCAVARAVHERLFLVAITDAAPHECLPAPLGVVDGAAAGASIEQRARAAAELGADALVALELTAAELARLATVDLPVPLIATVQSSSIGALQASLGRGAPGAQLDAVCGQAAVVGFSPEGRPLLVELLGPADASSSSSGPSGAASSAEGPGAHATLRRGISREEDRQPAGDDGPEILLPPPPAYAPPPRARPPMQAVYVDEDGPVALGAPPPSSWASDSPDHDPGWELARVDPASDPAGDGPLDDGTPFDAALARTRGSASTPPRPQFSPRPPPMHPQARALKGAGGLTFEPPSAPPGSAPREDPVADDDEGGGADR